MLYSFIQPTDVYRVATNGGYYKNEVSWDAALKKLILRLSTHDQTGSEPKSILGKKTSADLKETWYISALITFVFFSWEEKKIIVKEEKKKHSSQLPKCKLSFCIQHKTLADPECPPQLCPPADSFFHCRLRSEVSLNSLQLHFIPGHS